MIFYPSRRNNTPMRRHSSPRPLSTDPGDATHLTWMLKSFVMGITLLGLSYWLVQIAGVQYLASLTSATLLAFLLAYVVWCLLHKNRHSRQNSNSPSRLEGGNNSTLAATTETLTPTPPPPFDQHQAYKFNTPLPPRDSSPPPTYEEAVRAMLAMSAPNYPMGQLYATPPSSITPSTMSALTPSPTTPQSVTLSASALPQQVTPNSNSHFDSSSALSRSQHSLSALTTTTLANNQQQMSQRALTHSQQSLSALTTTPRTALNQSQRSLSPLTSSQMSQNALTRSSQSIHNELTPKQTNQLQTRTSSRSSSPLALISPQQVSLSALKPQNWSASALQQKSPTALTQVQQSSSALMLPSSSALNAQMSSCEVITPPPRFQTTSRPRQQTPPPPPPKPPSVYDISDVS